MQWQYENCWFIPMLNLFANGELNYHFLTSFIRSIKYPEIMKLIRTITLILIVCSFSTNKLKAQWETVLTDVIPVGIYVSPDFDKDKTVLVLDNNRVLFRSADGGTNWTKVLAADNPENPELIRVSVSPAFSKDSTAFIVINSGEVKKSVDFGLTWTLMAGLPGHISSIVFAPDSETSKTIYAMTAIDGPQEIFVSNDMGNTWALLYSLTTSAPGYPDMWISPEPQSPGAFAIDFEGDLYLTLDGGIKINKSLTGFENGLSDVKFSPEFSSDSTMFAADWKNVWINNKSGDQFSWTGSKVQNDKAPVKIAISPTFSSDHLIYAATSENVVKRSFDAGQSWDDFGSAFMLATSQIAITNTSPHILFLGLINSDFTSGKVLKSDEIYSIDNESIIESINCYPIPAKESVNISFKTKKAGIVEVTLIDVLGKKQAFFSFGQHYPGLQKIEVPLAGSSANAGIYFCRLQVGGELRMIKISVIK